MFFYIVLALVLTYQSTSYTKYTDRGLGRLGDVKQVIQQGLVFMVSEQVKFVQYKQDRLTALVP